jgi:hypothetical protein
MIDSNRFVRVASFAFLSFVLSTSLAMGQDPLKVAPHIFRLLFENDRVRVLQEWLRPGEQEPMHSHPRAIVYTLNSLRGKSISPSGKVTAFEADANEVSWSEGETHALENTGRTILRAIIVELKTPQSLPRRMSEGRADPLKVASRTHKLLFENNLVRVLEFHLLPGQRTRTYYQRGRVSYVLSGGILRETLMNGKVARQVFRPRQARWLEAGSHALENIGLTEVRLFTIELKNLPEQEKR